jgi:imidazolonepropionase-like amidohydrolase
LAPRALLAGYVLAQNPAFVEEAWRAYAAAKISIVMARELGVKMAMGSDASHRFHHVPDGALELEYYQELGWPALEVIKAATKTAAEAINRGDSLGTLAPGKVADILVVDGLSPRTCGAPRQAQHQVDVPGGSRAGVGTRPRYFRRGIQGRRMDG